MRSAREIHSWNETDREKKKAAVLRKFFRFVFLLSFTDDVDIKDENVDGVYVAKKASEKGAFFRDFFFLTYKYKARMIAM